MEVCVHVFLNSVQVKISDIGFKWILVKIKQYNALCNNM